MEVFVAQLLNGLVYGVLLFLIAAGLSLIFGLMNVVSLAHGSFFMLGAFFGLSIFKITGSFWLALVLAPIPVIVLGVLMELLFLRPLYRRGHLDQVLLTFGFTFVFLDLVQTLWGRTVLRLPVPPVLQGTVQIGLGVFSAYRLCLIGFGFAIALAAVAGSGPQPDRRHGACRRRQRGHGRRPRRQHPGAVHGNLRFRRGACRARRDRGRAGARPLSRNGFGNPHPGLHRHRHRRHGQLARRVRRQPFDRRRRYIRQGLLPEHRVVSDLSRHDGGAFDPAARLVRHQIFRRRDRALPSPPRAGQARCRHAPPNFWCCWLCWCCRF